MLSYVKALLRTKSIFFNDFSCTFIQSVNANNCVNPVYSSLLPRSDAQIDYEEVDKVQTCFLSWACFLKAYSLVSEVGKKKKIK